MNESNIRGHVMLQFYFLSIICNLLAGYALIAEEGDDSKPSIIEGVKTYVMDETFRLVLGVLTMIVGLFKILSVIRGDVPVIGDLFPAATGLTSGSALLYEFYKMRATVLPDNTEKFEQFFVKNRKWIGYAAIIAGGAHFLFPTVLFL